MAPAPHWPKLLVVATAVLGAGAALGITLAVLPEDSDGAKPAPTPRTSAPGTAPQSAPAGPRRLGPAPSAIPAVRDWQPVRGPGWEPGKGTRIVTDPDGRLADEARLLARELKVSTSPGPARTGDVELRLERGAKTGREGYLLSSREGQVRITGSADAGVFYGTRTLLQTVRAQGRFADGVVRDRPDRPQRGFSLDVARKHFSAEWIRARIKEMGDLKLNQFQLHFSDDQAFRIESDSHPKIVSSPRLTKKEVRGIVELAAERHITVIPEIDSPGHLGAVLKAYPQLQLKDRSGAAVPGAVNIADPRAGKVVDELLNEYKKLFPGKYWHLGGDEYLALTSEDPEADYPALAARARKLYGGNARVQDLATAWLNDRAKTVRKAGRMPQVWNDGMHADGTVRPDKPRQVTYWTGKEIGSREPVEYLKEGWPVLNLNDEYLYYVLGEPNDFTYPTGERIYREWTPAVLRGTSPVPAKLSGPDRVLGGRFAVWCDLAGSQTTAQVADGIRLPLAATAQKLWDPRKPALSWQQFTALADRVD